MGCFAVGLVAFRLNAGKGHSQLRMLKSLSRSASNFSLVFLLTFFLPAMLAKICHFNSILRAIRTVLAQIGGCANLALARCQTEMTSGTASVAISEIVKLFGASGFCSRKS